MYGWIHGCLRNMLIARFGEDVWAQIAERSGIDINHEITSYSPDDNFFAVTKSASEIVGIEESQVLEMYGMYFLEYVREQGHEGILLCLGNDIVEWINNVNQLHSHLRTSMPKMIAPEIWCEWESEDSFLLYYKSSRMAKLAPMVVGIVTIAARKYFSKIVSFERLNTQGINGATFTQWRVFEVDDIRQRPQAKMQMLDSANVPESANVLVAAEDSSGGRPEWVLKFVRGESNTTLNSSTAESFCMSNPSVSMVSVSSDTQPECSYCHRSPPSRKFHGLSFAQVHKLFPCHIVFDQHLHVLQVGERMRGFLPDIHLRDRMDHHFAVATPNVSWLKRWDDFEAVCSARPEFEIVSLVRNSREGNAISFSGPLSFADDGKSVMFLCSPNVHNLREMYDHKLSLSDMDAYGCRLQMVLQQDHLKSAQDTAHRMERLTEEVRAEKEKTVQLMKEVAEKAQEALATKKTFVRYVSHEIRTPLTVAKLGLLLVDEEMSAIPEAAPAIEGGSLIGPSTDIIAHLRDCEESLDVAVSILDDLLSYEKLESGIYELFRDVHPVVSFVKKSLKLFGVQAKQKRVEYLFDCRIPEDKIDAYFWNIDAKKMSQVMRNFVSNALKFTPPGGTVTVVVAFDPLVNDDENWDGKALPEVVKSVSTGTEYELAGIISVGFHDTGVGIERNNQSKLFNEIVQFSPNELQAGGGSGLGLWISRGIVDLHHGRTHMHSEGLGRGSVFFVDVPTYVVVTKPDDPLGSHSTGHFDALHARAGGNDAVCNICQGLKVLVVDDAIMIRKLITRVLKSRGCLCEVAEDGLAAVRAIERQIMEQDSAFDVILMDFVMPVMDGPSAVLQIRALGFRGAIIGVTGNMMPADVDHFMQCGADTVLPKPLVLTDLVSYLDYYFAKVATE